MKKTAVLIILFVFVSMCHSQSDGSFWWRNKPLINSASQARNSKDETSKIRTLPPRYRKEPSTTSTTSTTEKFDSIFDEFEEDDKKMFKYDDEPDCICTPKDLCNENGIIITDGNGLIDERSYNICGKDVCCRIPKTTTQVPSTTRQTNSITTKKPLFNFNISLSLPNLISTILKPLPNSNQSSPKCVSRKGKKIEERILIDENDDDENEFTGDTYFTQFPWSLLILKKNRKTRNFEYKCGAVLISTKTALTVNHCLKGTIKDPSAYLIRAGEWDRSSTFEFVAHQDRALSSIIGHPLYYSGGLFNDIAILKWITPLTLEVNVAPICLPDENEITEPGKYCKSAGWGKTSEEAQTTEILKFVKVPIVSRTKCEKQLQQYRLGSRFKLHESFICAGGEKGLDTCSNDGGSGLFCERSDGSYVLTGLVSWGLDCGIENVPGVYSSIQNLLSWIKKNI